MKVNSLMGAKMIMTRGQMRMGLSHYCKFSLEIRFNVQIQACLICMTPQLCESLDIV